MMDPRRNFNQENTSTPKRRRLGASRIWRPINQIFDKDKRAIKSPTSGRSSPLEKNDDEPLPCNQIEFLCDSGDNFSSTSIPCSPGVYDCSVLKNIENWESLVVSTNSNDIIKEASTTISKELSELDDLSDDMFISKLEQGSSQYNHGKDTLLTSRCDKYFREQINESFNAVNQSICNLPSENVDQSSLFETKDSFLLDIKESGIIFEEKSNVFTKPIVENRLHENNSFYGLPLIAKGLFKSFRNIEKFYDWQEECLSLPAIKENRNLIYALPTSGGKTLVAEVLMLREVLNRKRNALFILPFVAIVQEKMWSLSPFAVQLDFLIEEYAGGKGHLPPKKRRNKNSIYIATIEKGLALVRNLVELGRLDELGLVVVDELHLIGEQGRGGNLETLLSTILFMKKDIQIVGMSATIGNLSEIAKYLQADVFTRDFRPVELTEYVKRGDSLYKLQYKDGKLEVVFDRQLAFDYSAAGLLADPDRLGGLVAEVVPSGSCLVFCPTKRNCENVAALLCKLQRKEMALHRAQERAGLAAALSAEGGEGGSTLARLARHGVAYHHAGLASDERNLLEHAFRSGVISVICCTSTLAAGVNLPARRVIIRAPVVASQLLSLGAYRQMVGRAGRAGVCDHGESIIICGDRDWPKLRTVLEGGLPPARSMLGQSLDGLLLSAVALGLADTRPALRDLMGNTLLAVQKDADGSPPDIKQLCDESLLSLLRNGALETDAKAGPDECLLYDTSVFSVSSLGRAAIKGCMDLSSARQLVSDLELARRGLVVLGALHLLYLVTPFDHAGVRPDYRHYYSLYCGLDEEGVRTARALGITESNAIRMMTGKPITNVPSRVLCRFYLALMLRDLWNQVPAPAVADKYNIPRGTVQSILVSSSSRAHSASRACAELSLWPFAALLTELAPRLQTCAAPELQALMELPNVQKTRAMQLMKAGYKRIEDLAKASADDLVAAVSHLSRKAANHLVSSARMLLIEKVENLRAEAEDVMEELNT